MSLRKRERGATLALVVICAFVLALIVVAYFQLSLFFGGSKEMRNTTDAGALNVGKQVFTLKTSPQGGNEQQFDDTRDTSGQFGLSNINRAWARALMANINVAAMSSEGTWTGNASAHADSLYNAAQSISNRVADKVKDENNLHQFFENISSKNTLRMIGKNSTTKALPGQDWRTSLVDRGIESNIIIKQEQIPEGFNFSDLETKQASDNKTYLAGYKPMSVNNHNFTFVPFKVGERPHLISKNTFDTNTAGSNPMPQWNNAVPNAFSVRGESQGQQGPLTHGAVSYVQTNPQRQYNLSVVHSFIRIKFEDNEGHWHLNGIPVSDITYGFHTEQKNTIPYDVGTGTLTGYASLGNEYIPPTLEKAIYALPGNHAEVTKVLLQRCREMKHDFTSGELTALLSSQPFLPGEQEYVIFGTGNYASNEYTLMVSPKSAANAMAPWLNVNESADGSERNSIATEHSFGAPNFVWQVLAGVGCKPGPFWTTMDGKLHWAPSSGYNGCLGQLRIERETDMYVNGACTLF
jgi:hypothetical protein